SPQDGSVPRSKSGMVPSYPNIIRMTSLKPWIDPPVPRGARKSQRGQFSFGKKGVRKGSVLMNGYFRLSRRQ
ncbi:MAG TPA: hypothetical protein VMS21_06995, partial [Methylomirabilota bacterium]|nr:hypothetical protein [Methylomirabilota bacterium]